MAKAPRDVSGYQPVDAPVVVQGSKEKSVVRGYEREGCEGTGGEVGWVSFLGSLLHFVSGFFCKKKI